MKLFLKHTFLFILSLIVLSYVAVWIYEQPRREAIRNGTHDTHLKWQDIQSSEHVYNVIIVGSSRGDSAYNPSVIDSIAHTQSYNLCSGSQNIVESYYILKEVLKHQTPEFIVFDTFLPSFTENPDYYHVLSNGEFMSRSGRWDMIVNGFGAPGVVNYALPILKYKTYFKQDLKQMFSSTEKAQTKSKRIQGFYQGTEVVDATTIRSFGPLYSLENTTISGEKASKYLALIVALCKKNNVQFIPVRAPYPPSRRAKNPSDPAHDYFEMLYSDLGVSFYDFNNTTNMGLIDADFSDDRHLNFMGAHKVSRELGVLIQREQAGH